jgi:hypothetical protein
MRFLDVTSNAGGTAAALCLSIVCVTLVCAGLVAYQSSSDYACIMDRNSGAAPAGCSESRPILPLLPASSTVKFR